MDNSKVSIIMPVYNASRYVGEAIESVIKQSYENWELILINDASSDNSIEVIGRYLSDERIILLDSKINEGAAKSRNKGIDASNGRYIAFLDSDDIWHCDKLSKEIAFAKEKESAFTFTQYEFADENAVGLGKVVNVPQTLTYKQALSRTIIFTSTVLFDTNLITKDMIHMPIVASEDTATWWKILRSGYIAHGLNENLVLYRRPKSSLSSNKVVAIKRIWNLYRTEEKINLIKSLYYLFFWAIRATLRRV